MKYFMICILIFAISCNSPSNDKALTGVYTASYEHEFGITDDTLTVTKANDGKGICQVTRHSGLVRKLDGKKFPKEMVIETLVLEYNADKQIMTDLRQGRILIWDGKGLTLQLGAQKYRKISDL